MSKMSIFIPSEEIKYLSMIINLKEMNLPLPKEKMENIRQKCLSLQRNPGTIVLLTKLLGPGVIISLVS